MDVSEKKTINRIRVLTLLVALLSLIAGLSVRSEKLDEKKLLKGLAGEEVVFSEKKGQPPHYSSNTDIVAFNSYDIVPSIRGYAGPIKTLIAIDSKGIIRGVKIIQHRETENYVHYMLTPSYLKQFIGKSVTDPLKVDIDIDGISRATVSVKALAKTIRLSSRRVARELFGIRTVQKERASFFEIKPVTYLFLFFIAMGIYFITLRKKQLLHYRRVFLFITFLLSGVYISTPFSVLHVLNLMLGNYSTSLMWIVIVATTIIGLIIAGRIYCGWLCPFGALLELLDGIKIRKWKLSEKIDNRLRLTKYMLLIILVPVVLLSRRADYATFEPYLTIFSMHGNILMWALLILTVVINLKVRRFWCRYLCPVAAMLGMFSRRAGGYHSTPLCPMGNPPEPHISECIRCNICYGSRTPESE